MLLAAMTKFEADRGTVTCGAQHCVHHDLRDIDLFPPLLRLLHSVISSGSSSDSGVFLHCFEVFRHSILLAELILSSFREVVYNLPSEADIGHCIKDGFVRNVVTYSHDLSVEAGFNAVYVRSLPNASCHHRSTNVN